MIAQTTHAHNGQMHPLALLPTPTTPLAEAPCSVNLRFKVPGSYELAQATGRGLTPGEAVQNLTEIMQATLAALTPQPATPPVPPSRTDQLGALLARGMERATQAADWGLVERLAKAAALVLSGAVEPTDSPAVWAVRSQAHPDTWYEVSGKVCTCPDSQRAVRQGTGGLCKHTLAVCLTLRLI